MQLTGTHIAGIYFFLIFTYIWMPLAWILMRFLTPRVLVEQYFKQPHFTPAELTLFAHFPGTLMRTGIFMNLCVWPSKGKRRQMTELANNVPAWYVVASKCFVYPTLLQGSLIILFNIGYAIYFLATGQF